MDADPILRRLAEVLNRHNLEVIMVGNAAAAIQGVPITTIDVDFVFRRTAPNIRKLKAVARDLDATILRPFYPVSSLFRLSRDSDQLQVDFMSEISGIRSLEGLRERSAVVRFGEFSLRIASLPDIIKSKKACGRRQDLAALPILEQSLEEIARDKKGKAGSPERGK
jgi:hypothetical protein